MSHDLIIRDGLIIDSTSSDPYLGDVAIDNDTIVAVGNVAGSGVREIDAKGHAVTPGFVDLHTPLDAQAGWDPDLTSIVWHGVTTTLIGNCGATFTLCKPQDREYLPGMMESVEDIPSSVILNGLTWNWESYGEYLDSLEKLKPATWVIGDRGVDDEPTSDEIAQMAALAGESVAQGAIGLSSSQLIAHKMQDGRSIPGTFAKTEERVAIAEAVGDNNGLVQNVLEYSRLDTEMALLREQALAAQTRVIFTAPHIPSAPGKANACVDIVESSEMGGEGDNAPPLQSWISNFYALGDGESPEYCKGADACLPAIAKAGGEQPAATGLRTRLESNGEALSHVRFGNKDYDALEEFLKVDWILPSLGDTGAYLTQKAKGYLATSCNRKIIVANSELTGQRAGRVSRNQPNATAAAMPLLCPCYSNDDFYFFNKLTSGVFCCG